MKLINRNIWLTLVLIFAPLGVYSADLNIATIDPQTALLSTELAKQEIEEMRNSAEWVEIAEELQAKDTEAREIIEKNQKEGPTMSDEEKQEANKRLQSLSQDIEFLRKKLNDIQGQVIQLVQQQQAEKYQVIMTELIRAKAITLLLDRAQGSSLMYADESFDITQEVVDSMNQQEE
jgi:outer membrane protein|tara:strand:+ start:36 stop:566 length:531 start_codon:yes stop_codon:yes gene_type:complete